MTYREATTLQQTILDDVPQHDVTVQPWPRVNPTGYIVLVIPPKQNTFLVVRSLEEWDESGFLIW